MLARGPCRTARSGDLGSPMPEPHPRSASLLKLRAQNRRITGTARLAWTATTARTRVLRRGSDDVANLAEFRRRRVSEPEESQTS